MRPVSVHFDDDLEPMLQGPEETVAPGHPAAPVADPVEKVDPVVDGGQSTHDLPSPVRGIVVHHEYLHLRTKLTNLPDDLGDIAGFVIGWNQY